MNKSSQRLKPPTHVEQIQRIIDSIDAIFGFIPKNFMFELQSADGDMDRALCVLRAHIYDQGFQDGKTEGKHGSRALESYGKASTPGTPLLSMTEHRDVNELVETEGLKDPIKKKRRKVADAYRGTSKATVTDNG